MAAFDVAIQPFRESKSTGAKKGRPAKYPEKERRARALYMSGMSISRIGRELEVHRKTVQYWIKKFREGRA